MTNIQDISRLQAVGDAASELAAILGIGHGDAVVLLRACDAHTIAYTDAGHVIRSGRDDIAYRVTLATDAPTIDSARNADELLTALASIAPDNRERALSCRGVKILRATADLCGVGDAEYLGKRAAIAAILANF
jgi:hypothetical protein